MTAIVLDEDLYLRLAAAAEVEEEAIAFYLDRLINKLLDQEANKVD